MAHKAKSFFIMAGVGAGAAILLSAVTWTVGKISAALKAATPEA